MRTLFNTKLHRQVLLAFAFVVVIHWVEHLVQGLQIWALGWPRADAQGVLGVRFPWLVTSEVLHYAYALVMLAGFWYLRTGFGGKARTWWDAAYYIQIWHHFEHLLLFGQALTGLHLLGRPEVTSIAQLVFPRVELHLFYNVIVTVPMLVAMVYHDRQLRAPDAEATCSCAEPLWRGLRSAASGS